MATGRLQAFNFNAWIAEHQHLLKPTVGNQQVSGKCGPDGHRRRRPNPAH